MLNRLLSSGARLRLLLWLAGKLMPEPADLRPQVSRAVLGGMLVIACGVLAAVGVMLAVVSIYVYATDLIVVHQPALLMASAVSLLLATLGYLIAGRTILGVLAMPDQATRRPSKSSLASAVDATVDGFIDGFMNPPPKPEVKHEPVKPAPATGKDDDKVIPIIQSQASASEILHRHPKTKLTY